MRPTRCTWNLVISFYPAAIPTAVCWRIIIAQSLYALGASLCFISTRLSIGFIVLVQMCYVVGAPKWFAGRDRPTTDA